MRVVIESPYYSTDKEQMERNIAYAHECLRDSLDRGESPFASHLLYTRVLDDAKTHERQLGLRAAMLWIEPADFSAVYIDLGISSGMRLGIEKAFPTIPIKLRSLRGGSERVRTMQPHFDRDRYWPVSVNPPGCEHAIDRPVAMRAPEGSQSDSRIIAWRCACGDRKMDAETAVAIR
jgi:hypothetical protein